MNEAIEAAGEAVEDLVNAAMPSRKLVIAFAGSAISVMALWIAFLAWLAIRALF